MKVEFLNDEKTEALVTVGWIWKKQATLIRSVYYGKVYWEFSGTTKSWWREDEIEKARGSPIWTKVAKLPEARWLK